MKKIIMTISALLALTLYASAQYVDQALTLSQQSYGVTARAKAMGSAFGALGGDFSSLSINPAGIAVYRSSEMTFTPDVFRFDKTEATNQGYTADDSKYNFSIANAGYVGTYRPGDTESGLVSVNFGLGFNRLRNFHQNSLSEAMNSPYSRMDAFAQNTNGINYNDLVTTDSYDPYYNGIPWESKMAWENYLIDVANPGNGDNQYNSILYQGETVNQHYAIQREGYINEYVLALGANFSDKFYIGATVGIDDLYYLETSTYGEDGGSNGFGNFDYYNYLRTTGLGFNVKVGMIFRPIPQLRLGAAVHTPTFFNLKENYHSWMSSNLDASVGAGAGSHREETPHGDYKYDLETPFRAIGSVAYQFGKKGLLSVDYEYVNYNNIKLRHGSDGYDFYSENQDISNYYQSIGNIRVGGEYRVTPAISLRGGYEYYGSPYKSTVSGVSQPNSNYQHVTYNGGLGFRFGNTSLDIAYGLTDLTRYNYPYQLTGVQVEPIKYHSMVHDVMFTMAFRF
ncbi:OmpP1/FadL family transporter [Prolixibacter sp. NT017]|uniref:OmpP1/FadL family transporter n=1 Tax=Prolixibacter sp. NT017 TaxID=2652390 RepID=UPI0012994680|nr:outer membrane protein transport protein [Prolixibacter sp. NT017]